MTDKQKFILWLIVVAFVCISGTIAISSFISGCNKPEQTTIKRDSIIQKAVDSVLKVVVPELQKQDEKIDSALMITNQGITENKIRYKEVARQHQEQPVNQSYEWIKKRLGK